VRGRYGNALREGRVLLNDAMLLVPLIICSPLIITGFSNTKFTHWNSLHRVLRLFFLPKFEKMGLCTVVIIVAIKYIWELGMARKSIQEKF
jgi:hypothetical protein